MKTQRRSFVVEYKTHRRPSKPQPKSIWGNLDLGAVARQVDADDVLPAEQPTRAEPVEAQQVEQASSLNAVIDTENVPEVGDDRQPLADASPGIVDTDLTKDPEPAIDDARPAGRAAKSSQRTRKRRSAASKPSVRSVHASRSSAALNASSTSVDLDDDIEALDAENRRLRRLMAEKLRRENDWLQSILDRFEKIPEIDLG